MRGCRRREAVEASLLLLSALTPSQLQIGQSGHPFTCTALPYNAVLGRLRLFPTTTLDSCLSDSAGTSATPASTTEIADS